MDKIFIGFILIIIVSTIAIIITSKNAKQGKIIPLKFRHIQGMPNLMEGEIVKISSDNTFVKIDNKHLIPKERIKYKTVTTSKMLTDKQKSVVQRSLVGIAIAGPLGAIVGGLSGIGNKQTVELVHFLILGYTDDEDVDRTAMFALEDISHLMYLNMFAIS